MRQSERKAETRARLLDAAADLFAEHGIAGASVDAIAERAGRTVGALYGHFDSKEELLFGVVDEWLADVATVVAAELALATSTDERLAALWRAVSQPSAVRWMALEHEVWSYATRNPDALRRLRSRYAAAWQGIETIADEWPEFAGIRGRGPAVVGLLLGMTMMRRIDPQALTDDMALAALHALVDSALATEGVRP